MGAEIPLYRQIHPKWIQDGMITSEAFRPFDGDLLSLYNGEMINAEDSFKHYTEECGNVSCGVAEVAESVFVKNGLDVIKDGDPFPEHVSVDYSPFKSDSSRKRVSQKIKKESRLVYSIYESGFV
ncbi:MAG: hypothetical protein IKH39_03815 [Candidatus Methanomethylophilaceae archaeon]|nr:hypothetical protein [Candidatus Methanomethylophilaceae archaeon]